MMDKRSKKAGLLLAGVVVVAVIAIATWSGKSSAKPPAESGSNSYNVASSGESQDDLQSASPATRSSPQAAGDGSRLQATGELAADTGGAADTPDETKKKSRRKKKGRRARQSAQEDEEQAAQTKGRTKKPLPGV